eukprot:scaffold95690_cov32-Tisochrysis_lutea.AAC.1
MGKIHDGAYFVLLDCPLFCCIDFFCRSRNHEPALCCCLYPQGRSLCASQEEQQMSPARVHLEWASSTALYYSLLATSEASDEALCPRFDLVALGSPPSLNHTISFPLFCQSAERLVRPCRREYTQLRQDNHHDHCHLAPLPISNAGLLSSHKESSILREGVRVIDSCRVVTREQVVHRTCIPANLRFCTGEDFN